MILYQPEQLLSTEIGWLLHLQQKNKKLKGFYQYKSITPKLSPWSNGRVIAYVFEDAASISHEDPRERVTLRKLPTSKQVITLEVRTLQKWKNENIQEKIQNQLKYKIQHQLIPKLNLKSKKPGIIHTLRNALLPYIQKFIKIKFSCWFQQHFCTKSANIIFIYFISVFTW